MDLVELSGGYLLLIGRLVCLHDAGLVRDLILLYILVYYAFTVVYKFVSRLVSFLLYYYNNFELH